MASRRRDFVEGIIVERSCCSLCREQGYTATIATRERSDFKLCYRCVWTCALQLLARLTKRPHRDTCACLECGAFDEAHLAPPSDPKPAGETVASWIETD